MPGKCKCGGELVIWSNNKFYFIRKCNKCSVKYKQRKRQKRNT